MSTETAGVSVWCILYFVSPTDVFHYTVPHVYHRSHKVGYKGRVDEGPLVRASSDLIALSPTRRVLCMSSRRLVYVSFHHVTKLR